jgi:hypothetical protein
MNRLHLASIFFIFILAASCQKGVEWASTPSTGGTGGSGGGGTTGGGSNGNLLVKAMAITAGTTDTNMIYVTWDANQRLTQYKSTGKTNGIDASAQYDITRLPGGNIQKIFSKPFATLPGGGGAVDSVVHLPFYQAGTSKLQYVKTTTYTSTFNLVDSIVFTYNTAGMISMKKTYRESLVSGMIELQAQETYTYDTNGNLLTTNTSMADPFTGVLSPIGNTTMTYNTHKGPSKLGEEAYIILSPENASPNYINTKIQTGTSGGGGVTGTITASLSNTQYNSFDRPTKGTISTSPVPPGYVLLYTYYYQ